MLTTLFLVMQKSPPSLLALPIKENHSLTGMASDIYIVLSSNMNKITCNLLENRRLKEDPGSKLALLLLDAFYKHNLKPSQFSNIKELALHAENCSRKN